MSHARKWKMPGWWVGMLVLSLVGPAAVSAQSDSSNDRQVVVERDARSTPHAQRDHPPSEDFLEFDRAYIPALALTNQGKLPASRQALQRLAQFWAASSDRIEAALGDAEVWRVVAAAVQRSLSAAADHLQNGESKAAHESLEPIRELMAAARRSVDIDYPLDLLTDFHATMEAIVQPAAKGSLNETDREYLDRLPGYLSQATLQWRRVERANLGMMLAPDRDHNGLDAIIVQVQAVRQALNELQLAVQKDSTADILRAAQGLKPPFAQLYMSFGDFRRS